MKYQITVEGIHCSGCVNLIKMMLEDEGLEQVDVNQETGIVKFSSDYTNADLNKSLEKAFNDLPGYTYSNLTEEK